jgi:AhpD family alkylhydroperoxidase
MEPKNERYQPPKSDPEGFKELFQMEAYFDNIQWIKPILHLVKIRASQINQCAYCINMHANKALADGESCKRILLLNAWSETSCFSSKEKRVGNDRTYHSHSTGRVQRNFVSKGQSIFTGQQIAQVAMVL